ncbi:unnamed protein product [Linum trigynum]|uniref:Uncharacterized protein n=1 Tax=Linum trigynum TaxID=586398 RepID=A0AAV2EJ36_9ROSI
MNRQNFCNSWLTARPPSRSLNPHRHVDLQNPPPATASIFHAPADLGIPPNVYLQNPAVRSVGSISKSPTVGDGSSSGRSKSNCY